MKLSDVLKIAIKNMRVNILQTIIIITVMAIGIGVITIFLGSNFGPLREPVKEKTEEQSNQYTLTINSGGETFLEENIIAMGKEIFEPVDFKIDHLYELKKSCSAVDYIFPAYFQEANIYLPNNSEEKEEKRVSFARTIPNHFDFIDLELEKGNTFTKQDVKNKNRVIVLRKDIAEKLFGTENPLGKEIKTEKRGSFEVIGVFRENSQDKYLKKREGFIPFSVTDFLSTNEIEHIKVGFKEKNRIPKAERQIENYLENEFGGGYRIDNNVNMENDKSNKFNKYNLIFAFVFSLGLLIALI
ncbi:MAG: ABC transporter permease, partial [Halanaerobiaceae bacterium]